MGDNLSELADSDVSGFLRQSVDKSIARHGFSVSEDARRYVCGVLEEFIVPGKLFTTYNLDGEPVDNSKPTTGEQIYGLRPITFQHFEALEARGAERTLKTRNLAEHCLFLVGFCYDQVRRKGTARFHTDMGAFAYDSLGRFVVPGVAQTTYPEIAENFWEMGAVIGDLHLPTLRKDGKRINEVMCMLDKTRDKRYQLLLKGVFGTDLITTGWG